VVWRALCASVHVIGALVGGLLLVAAIAALSGLFFPLKWWWRKKELRKLIQRRVEFILVYQPHENYSKTVVFLNNGQIGGEGRNKNEDTWRIRRGCLEFLTDDGKVYSRFRFDKTTGRLACTNDPDLRSRVRYLASIYSLSIDLARPARAAFTML
jgi:hypothetical protein